MIERWLRSMVVVVILIAARGVVAGGSQRPNIIFFLGDDHRWDQLGCAGHPIVQTPHIDALADRGTRFRRAFVTTPICAASRASIFTSLYERTHGFTFRTPPLDRRWTDQSYPALLRQAGYRTGFIGKFGVNVQAGVTKQMFDFFRPVNRSPYFKTMPDGTRRHTTQICGDYAIEFLRQQSQDQRPFCLSVSFNAPHAEDSDKQHQYPAPYVVSTWYEDVDIPEPRLADAAIYSAQPELLKRSLNRVRYYWRWDTPEKYQKNIRGYYRMVSGIDHVVGRVQEELERLGLDQNTVIVYSGDNGYYLAQRGFAGKWSHYEESLRVPLIVFDPRRQPAKPNVCDAIALNIDIPATIVDLAGVDVPGGYQGASLVPWMRGQTPAQWRSHFFCEHLMEYPIRIPKWEGVRTEQFKYARYFEQDPPAEFLHDLKSDPDELINLAQDSRYEQTRRRLSQLCNAERDRLGGPYQKPEPARTDQPRPAATGRNATPKSNSARQSSRDRSAPQTDPPPNVVMIISDDQAWTDYGFMGHPIIQTPRLDRLSRESVTFTRGYVPTSLCRPSLMSMITGLYPSQHGVTGNDPAIPASLRGTRNPRQNPAYRAQWERLRNRVRDLPTIPRLLQQRGYVSFQSGKWWEGSFRNGGFTHGMTHGDPARGGRHGDAGLAIGRQGLQPIYDFIEHAVDEKKPFFVWYAPFLPHSPHNPPERLLKKYRADGRPVELAKYYAMCEWFDETCGELLDYLDVHRLSKNTLVLYVCDNGWIQRTPDTRVPAGWRSGFAPKSKQSPYDGGVRTPIMVRWKGKFRPRRPSSLVSSLDLMPTVLDACGVELPSALPGTSLLPVCQGKQRVAHQAVFGEGFAHDIADIDDPSKSRLFRWGIHEDWKTILKFSGKVGRYAVVHSWMSRDPELYDLAADPHERENRAERYPKVVQDLRQRIDAEFAKWGSPRYSLRQTR